LKCELKALVNFLDSRWVVCAMQRNIHHLVRQQWPR